MLNHHDVMRVIADLVEGWGVEDIALRRRLSPAFVRKVIANLRACGTLEALLGRGRAA